MPRGTLFHRPTPSVLPVAAITKPMDISSTAKRRRKSSVDANNKQILFFIALQLLIFIIMRIFMISNPSTKINGHQKTWHGGHPAQDRSGSCWCGDEDGYCMCTPALSVDIVLYEKRGDSYSVWAVRRKDTGQLGTIGGFVEVGETPIVAVLRECEEETGITIPKHLAQAHGHTKSTDIQSSVIRLIGVYSDPRRDSRRSNVSTAYALQFNSDKMSTKDGSGVPKAGDDAKEVVSIPIEDIGTKYKGEDWFADHLTILLDFKEQLLPEEGTLDRSGLGELADDVKRSTCS